MGAALGGFLGTFIPIPILGTLIGGTLGVFVGDLLYTLMFGGGMKAVGQKLKDTMTSIFKAGTAIKDFVVGGFGRFYKGIPKFKIPDFPEDAPEWITNAGNVFGWGRERLWGALKDGLKVLMGPASLLMGKEIPNSHPPMREWWDRIDLPKYDISNNIYASGTGTGIICFDNQKVIY